MTSWSDAGFGTDPEGDARRRAELDTRRVDPVAAIRAAIDASTGAAYRTSDDRLPAEVLDGELLTSEPDPHAITRVPYSWGVLWRCACGRWEGAATGRGSAAFVEGDYARHRRDEGVGRVE